MMSVTQLGYLGIGVSDLAAWEQFATQTLGLQANVRDEDGTLFLKMDEYHHRFALHANANMVVPGHRSPPRRVPDENH